VRKWNELINGWQTIAMGDKGQGVGGRSLPTPWAMARSGLRVLAKNWAGDSPQKLPGVASPRGTRMGCGSN